jgi:hypothetical protein
MKFRDFIEESDSTVEDIWAREDLNSLIREYIFDLSSEDIKDFYIEILYILDPDNYEDYDLDLENQSLIDNIFKSVESISDNVIYYLTDYFIEIIDNEGISDEDNVSEKMTNQAKMKARKLRKKPAYKKAVRLKKKCKQRFHDKIKKTENANIPYVCGSDGKLHKGMKRKDRIKLKKKRKRNKNKIIK